MFDDLRNLAENLAVEVYSLRRELREALNLPCPTMMMIAIGAIAHCSSTGEIISNRAHVHGLANRRDARRMRRHAAD